MSAQTERVAAPPRERARAAGTASRLSLQPLAASLGRIATTARLETRLNLASPGPWVIGLFLSVFAYLIVRTVPDPSSFPLGWNLSRELGPLSGVLLLFMAASLAHRPRRYEITELLDSKIVASEELVLGRWLGMVAAVLAPLVMEYGVMIAGQAIHAKPPVLPVAYLDSLGRMLPPVLFLSTLAFCLVTLTRVLVLGAGLAGLLWFALNAGQAFYPTVFRMELSQNGPFFLGLTFTTLLALLLGYQGRRREKRSPVARGLAWLCGLACAATALHGVWVHLALPERSRSVAAWRRLQSSPRRNTDALPNFAWNDQSPGGRGRRISLAALRGRPALLVFLQPKDTGMVPLLERLSALRREFAADKLEVVAVLLSDDLNAAAHAARAAGADLPVVTDWGRPAESNFDRREPPSVASWALRVRSTPSALLVDGDGREKTRELALDETAWKDTKARLRAELDGVEDEAPPAAAALGRGM